MQVVWYYQYLKGNQGGIGPRKEELQLYIVQRIAERTRDPKALNVAMAKLLGAKLFCTCELYLVGEKVFGSQKQKAYIPLDFEGKSHQPDKMNFSCPQIATKSNRANHVSCSLSNMVEELSLKL